MARGRNGAPKKSGTSSSMDKGRVREFMLELARVFPSQKEKMGFNKRCLKTCVDSSHKVFLINAVINRNKKTARVTGR